MLGDTLHLSSKEYTPSPGIKPTRELATLRRCLRQKEPVRVELVQELLTGQSRLLSSPNLGTERTKKSVLDIRELISEESGTRRSTRYPRPTEQVRPESFGGIFKELGKRVVEWFVEHRHGGFS